MSFSQRDSVWANSALVVTVDPDDVLLDPYRQSHGVLAGLAFQIDMERQAYQMSQLQVQQLFTLWCRTTFMRDDASSLFEIVQRSKLWLKW